MRVLLVEDEYLVAIALEDALGAEGHHVIGPVPRLHQAVDLARTESLDGAILDVNLKGEWVFPAADILLERKIPFLFVTGYDQGEIIPPRHRGAARITKPFDAFEVVQLATTKFKAVGNAS